jgi:DNA repair exonuclease SbcCD nuclease subunit
MFSFLHAADLHLDSPLRGLSRHEGAPVEEIRGATRRALSALVDFALAEKVSFVVIAGDLYDGDQKDYGTALFFHREMLRLQEAQIPVVAIRGNHDAESVITKALTLPENVTFLPVQKPGSFEVPGLPVTIHGQGFARPAVTENLVPEYPEGTPGRFHLGLLHTSLTGHPRHDPYAPCSLGDLEKKNYQYWALGHIHQPEVIRKNPWVVYSGNLQGRKINETGARGCYLVEVDDSLEVCGHEFVPLDVVRWEHLELDLSGFESLEALRAGMSEVMAGAFAEAGDRLLAIRLTLAGATALHGALHADPHRWQAEGVSVACEIDPNRIWFEKLKLATTPVRDLAELAQRDDLTALVLESLAKFEPTDLPPSVASLESKLPPSVRGILEEEGGNLKEDIAALVLHSITAGATDD